MPVRTVLDSPTLPGRGLDAFAVGIERHRKELGRKLGEVSDGEGDVKFLRGGYGCGKTFMANLLVQDAQQEGFATSFVVVSDNDLHFHKFDELYEKVVGGLSTSACPQGALGDILDRWIGAIEEGLIELGVADDDPAFEDKLHAKLDEQLQALTGERAPADMVRVVRKSSISSSAVSSRRRPRSCRGSPAARTSPPPSRASPP